MGTEIIVVAEQQEFYAVSALRIAYRAWFFAEYLRKIAAIGEARQREILGLPPR